MPSVSNPNEPFQENFEDREEMKLKQLYSSNNSNFEQKRKERSTQTLHRIRDSSIYQKNMSSTFGYTINHDQNNLLLQSDFVKDNEEEEEEEGKEKNSTTDRDQIRENDEQDQQEYELIKKKGGITLDLKMDLQVRRPSFRPSDQSSKSFFLPQRPTLQRSTQSKHFNMLNQYFSSVDQNEEFLPNKAISFKIPPTHLLKEQENNNIPDRTKRRARFISLDVDNNELHHSSSRKWFKKTVDPYSSDTFLDQQNAKQLSMITKRTDIPELSQIELGTQLEDAQAMFQEGYEYFFIYTRIKYHDDGHDYVSRLQFICLHLTFSMSSAWLTYITVFCVFNSISQDSTKNAHFLNWPILDWEKLFQILMFCQACINLAYYKDIFFSLIVSAVFLGQYLRGLYLTSSNKQKIEQCQKDPLCNSEQNFFGQKSQKLAFGLFIVLILFIILTILTNFRSVVYLKYSLLMQKLRVMQNKGLLKSKERAADKAQITSLDPNLMKNAPAVVMGSMFSKSKELSGRRKNVFSRRELSHPFLRDKDDSFIIQQQAIDIEQLQQDQMARFDQLEPVKEQISDDDDDDENEQGVVSIYDEDEDKVDSDDDDIRSQCSINHVFQNRNIFRPVQTSEQVNHYFSYSNTLLGEEQSHGINIKPSEYMYYRINNSDQMTDSFKSNLPLDQNNNLTIQNQKTEESECHVPIELFQNGVFQRQDFDASIERSGDKRQRKSIKRKYTNKKSDKKSK